ncbi:MaoC/PaaZ C-terminal domain-containing protein [Tsuneonella sp. CC-YZS046]|uniref:MaoC/PaaZ C-terminal domain-containing protein n=1 Tax=Tsuneonella sp. CC-YZS046 TaxID=3042152 RepID=UPI002D76CDB8|nr:MaoC/PaaZ C-terminal domain-containing protein [Tsuneonella sp. CC-YZS046]WRO67067.1 MaoC/PaaZ C-terminal domain-containing protein [Tsuneonella sp. CC-YZS046]
MADTQSSDEPLVQDAIAIAKMERQIMSREFIDPPVKWFEDFELGDVMTTRGRTIDIGDITTFAGLTGDHYQLHTDGAFMESNRFGQRIAHGALTFSIAIGLFVLGNFYGNAIAAMKEISGLVATKPVFPGDTLHVVATVIGHEATGPKYGTLAIAYSVRNQRDEEVMTFVQTTLAKRRPEEAS